VPSGRQDPITHDWSAVRFVLCDLDGVVWLAHHAIPGAPQAIERLRQSGRRVLFVTNNSFALVADQEAALGAIGVPAEGDVVTSAQAAARLVDAGERVLVCGGPGVVEAVASRSATPLAEGPADAVIVGFHRSFDYERLRIASAAVREGARLIATNDDATYPTPDGPIPGGGAILASVVTASGAVPTIAGKPHAPMAELVRERCGPEFGPATALMVGDRWSTDGAFAEALGCPFALVRSGVTPSSAAVAGAVALDLPDLAAVADAVLGDSR
jgi:4-nitrophenyl phosphatase